MTDTRFEQELKNQIKIGQVIVVVGSGVSVAASKGHPQASWRGLLENGLAWVQDKNLIEPMVAQAHTHLLKANPRTHNFISAATDITEAMGGAQSKLISKWLEPTIGQIKAKEHELLEAIHALRLKGNLLATTNYDGLLLENSPQLTPLTWKDKAFLKAVTYREKDKILYLHGYWREPESVVLDWDSYESIARDQTYRENLAAIWKTHTWLFVGCGVDGLSDPDFGLLLERYGKHATQAGIYDYCLVKGKHRRDEFAARFKEMNFNIRAISYGEEYSDLPAYLSSLLPEPPKPKVPQSADGEKPSSSNIPKAPRFYAKPDYIGSHQFVGRSAELDTLSDWAHKDDQTCLLLFEAIGGNGKSMLTWEWVTNHSEKVRTDWAGRFWYSFYERGAYMQNFCQHALAYITGNPLEEFKTLKTLQMKDQLIAELHEKPWLLILDGLERVLVAYHRYDAAQIRDEEANAPTDEILNRNPRDTIRDEDSDLLRTLAGCAPSKILISSRLTPRVLINPGGLAIPGTQRMFLAGLRPTNAEALLKSCGVRGNSAAIRTYLQKNCANHPLVIGILAGLINQPGPNRGDFDGWSKDPCGGAQLNLGKLDLVKRRNHILKAAIGALSENSKQLLSMLSLISESVTYDTLQALSLDLFPSDSNPSTELAETVSDLERRGLLQFDLSANNYDLHPVVRGVVSGGLGTQEKVRLGQQVVDYFSEQSSMPYAQAESMKDLKKGLQVYRTLLNMGRYKQAAKLFQGDLSRALLYNLEAHSEILSLLQPFFASGWEKAPSSVDIFTAESLSTLAGGAFGGLGQLSEALTLHMLRVQMILEQKVRWHLPSALINVCITLIEKKRIAKAEVINNQALELAMHANDHPAIFACLLQSFAIKSHQGHKLEALEIWDRIFSMGFVWTRDMYVQGDAEKSFVFFKFFQGMLTLEDLAKAEAQAKIGNNRLAQRELHKVRAQWALKQENYSQACESFQKAIKLARERGILDATSETGLILAKVHLGQLDKKTARLETERLSNLHRPAHYQLARLYQKNDDHQKAKYHAVKAFHWAWADGEPYVQRYYLNEVTDMLREMQIPLPNLPDYDPTKEEIYPWETDLQKVIDDLRAEKEEAK